VVVVVVAAGAEAASGADSLTGAGAGAGADSLTGAGAGAGASVGFLPQAESDNANMAAIRAVRFILNFLC
jgi:hypothetical protein